LRFASSILTNGAYSRCARQRPRKGRRSVSDLGEDLARAYEARVAAADVELTAAAIRAVVRQLGGGEGRAQVAAGTRALAGELGVAVRTVQRW